MYTTPFSITDKIGNNVFGYSDTHNSLFVPSIIDGTIFDLALTDKPTFREEVDGAIQEFHGLQSFIRTSYSDVPMIIVDNHNHVFYFWYEALQDNTIQKDTLLVHVDEHQDTRTPDSWLPSDDLPTVFDYTNNTLNIGNFIPPAEQDRLIKQTIQITWEWALVDTIDNPPKEDYILDFDVDFFSEGMSYFDEKFKKESIRTLAKNAKLITVATSPLFIRQQNAIELIQEIFSQ